MDLKNVGTANTPFDVTSMKPDSGIDGRSILSLKGDKSMNDKQKVEVLAKEFESIFLNQMLKSMRSTIQKNKVINGGSGEEMFQGMQDEELARQMAYAQNGGLSSALVSQLTPMLDGGDKGKTVVHNSGMKHSGPQPKK